MSTKQKRIAELAGKSPAMAFTSLNQYLDAEWLRYAYECTRKDGAVGADGQTAQDYAANLEQNLQSLLDQLKSGRYRAPPVRRHYIDKPDGGQRALGIPSFEDKVAQRAIVMLLEPIYEQDFRNCSFGFRSGRNAHQALEVIRRGILVQRARWVLEVDVRKYFDSIDHAKLREMLARRVTDGVVRRMIDKWLKAGVLEQGQLSFPGSGTPQGGVITPRTQKAIFSSSASLSDGGTCRCLTLDVNGNTYMTYVKGHCRRKGRAIERCAPSRGPRVERAGCGADPDPRVRSIAASSISVRAGGPGDRPSGAGDRVVDPGDVQDPCERCTRSAHVRSLERTDAGADSHPRDYGLPRRRGQAWLSAKDAQATTRFASTTPSIGACRASSLRRTSFSSQTACGSLVSAAA